MSVFYFLTKFYDPRPSHDRNGSSLRQRALRSLPSMKKPKNIVLTFPNCYAWPNYITPVTRHYHSVTENRKCYASWAGDYVLSHRFMWLAIYFKKGFVLKMTYGNAARWFQRSQSTWKSTPNSFVTLRCKIIPFSSTYQHILPPRLYWLLEWHCNWNRDGGRSSYGSLALTKMRLSIFSYTFGDITKNNFRDMDLDPFLLVEFPIQSNQWIVQFCFTSVLYHLPLTPEIYSTCRRCHNDFI